MKKVHRVKKEVEEYKEIRCNKCGKSCKSKEDPSNFYGLFAEVTGHFYSPCLEDCQTYKFDICEACLVKLFKTFKVPVEKENSLAFRL
jgi:hypothetical protein